MPINKKNYLRESVKKFEYEIEFLENLVTEYKINMNELIRLDIADPYIDTPLEIKYILLDAIYNKPDATHYTGIRGLPKFLESVSKFYKEYYSINVNPYENVLVTAGSSAGIYIVLSSLIESNDEVIIPNPTFPNYSNIIKLLNGKPVFVPLTEDYHLDIDIIRKNISERTKAIIICNPNNPTGTVYTQKELEELMNLAKEYDLIIISDEVYSTLIYDNIPYISLAKLDKELSNTIIINSLSKTFAMTGWRLGYVIANEELIKNFEKLAFEIQGSVNTAVQYAGAYANENWKILYYPIRTVFAKLRDFTVRRLREIGIRFITPQAGFEMFPFLPEGFNDSIEFTKYLLAKANVLVKPGIFFGPNGDKNFRIVFCRSQEELENAFNRIEKIIKN
jgi:aspartate aminotransferase